MKAFRANPLSFILSIFFSFQTVFLFAQDKPPILTTSKPAYGIYRDFQEFVSNAPSITNAFQVLHQSGEQKIKRGTGNYKLILLDSTKRRKDLKKFWGFSDGTDIYVNEIRYGGSLNFKKIQGLGRYCYFKGSNPESTSGAAGMGALVGGLTGGLVAAGLAGLDDTSPYILNINNGNFYLLNKEVLNKVLQQDKELFEDYLEQEKKKKGDTIFSYIERYNERNAEEIKYNKPVPVSVLFYRRSGKVADKSVDLIAGDTTQIRLLPNSLQQVTWMSDSIDVCVGSQCKTLGLDKWKVNYIECSSKAGQSEFRKVDRKVGEFYEREIRYSKEKK